MSELIKRFWDKDVSLWSEREDVQKSIAHRLGWMDLPEFIKERIPELENLASQIKEQKFTQLVLLGMGGSSLCPYVFSTIFGSAPGFPHLLVLDSTDPDFVRRTQARINLGQTLFVMASKSGGTIEPNSLFKHFYTLLNEQKEKPGRSFLALTDPDTSLEELAREHNFAHTFTNPADIGGRYSALSYFGLIPAAAIGMNLQAIYNSANEMKKACMAQKNNPALELASFMAENVARGKDKFTILVDSCLAPFGLWLEQLIAESTGKGGTGVVPVVDEPPGIPEEYGEDRFFISIGLNGHGNKSTHTLVDQLTANGLPVRAYTLQNPYQLAGEFLKWEAATALCGHLLKINPFDEPNVTESKQNTARILEYFTTYGKMPRENEGTKWDWAWRCSPALKKMTKSGKGCGDPAAALGTLCKHIETGGYLSVLAYLPHEPEVEDIAARIRALVRKKTGRATTFGFGPRYLHSSGQLHKGGPPTGSFLIITRNESTLDCAGPDSLPIPGEGYNFNQLQFAQALGDFRSLCEKKRPALHLEIDRNYPAALQKVYDIIYKALM